jgi:predicted RNA-binding Zn-ribbon protein involved in translation (DUF1610 family)
MSDDRKYRHRGYMDSGSDKPRGPRGNFEGAPPKTEGAPRGRSAGFDKELVVRCKKCGEAVRGLDAIETATVCPKCGTALHACAQCRHFDSSSRWECRQHARIPARVPDKSAANSCPVFEALASFDLTGAKAASTPSDARRAFDALFKK